MSELERVIHVYADWDPLKDPKIMGEIHEITVRGKELVSFEYDPSWLSESQVLIIDPDLQLYRGRQYPGTDRSSFGLFMDSSPDRWGRLLMRRREALTAAGENHRLRKLSESDFLLGVHDTARMGGLRFKTDSYGAFLANDTDAIPPYTRLRELEQAAVAFDSESGSPVEKEWLELLLIPGSSLGGARPKANVVDPSGLLWIAKFPSKQDEEDSGLWEMVVHDLALRAGLDVPEARLEQFSRYGSTFMVKRFDRTSGGTRKLSELKRIHFTSAMTMLGKNDGASARDGSSYLELAELIVRYGSEPDNDLSELWRRIIFSIAVSNTDDHLRNHGFLLSSRGWRLSPLYDVNPNPYGRGLSLNISGDDNSLDFFLALKQAGFFRLDEGQALHFKEQICDAVAGWRETALDYGASRGSIERMKPA
ncbi:MAG: type II toxin-antitoxin system HipA family toxin, partial [Spirochaetes bacterium]